MHTRAHTQIRPIQTGERGGEGAVLTIAHLAVAFNRLYTRLNSALPAALFTEKDIRRRIVRLVKHMHGAWYSAVCRVLYRNDVMSPVIRGTNYLNLNLSIELAIFSKSVKRSHAREVGRTATIHWQAYFFFFRFGERSAPRQLVCNHAESSSGGRIARENSERCRT